MPDLKDRVTASDVKKLRDATGANIMACQEALKKSHGDFDSARAFLKKNSQLKAMKREGREAGQGIIISYVHTNRRIGAMVELRCETDFVANNNEFMELGKDIAMHIAAMKPDYIKRENVPDDFLKKSRKDIGDEVKESGKPQEIMEKIIEGKMSKLLDELVLYSQPFIKDQDVTVEALVHEMSAKTGEKIEVARICRFEI